MENIIYFLGSAIILLYLCYYLFNIGKLLYHRLIAKRLDEDLTYPYGGSVKDVIIEILCCLAEVFLIVITINSQDRMNVYRTETEIERSRLFLYLNIGAIILFALKLIHVVIYLKLPLIITEKYFIINGKTYKSHIMRYTLTDDQLILAMEYPKGKTKKLLQISQSERRIVHVIRKYSRHTSIDNIIMIDS